jgi:SAM-dependent methyltransferase
MVTLTPTALRELAMSFQASRVVLTAFELDVFTALGDEARSSGEIAGELGADPRGLDRLLNALVALGLLQKDRDLFRNAPVSAQFLVRGRPDYMAGLHHTVHLWDSWSGLTRAVREGTPAIREDINERGDRWLEAFIGAMHWRAQAQAAAVAALIDLSWVRRVLDVGGGSGAFSIAFARQQPGLEAVVFDLPNVVPLTRRYVEEAGLSTRITALVGDYTRDDLPAGFDLVFLSAIVHSNGPDENRALVRKAAAALAPGGRVAVLDWVMCADRTAPTVGALFALNMLVATTAGDTYTEDEMRAWLESSGLGAIERRDTPFGTALLVAGRDGEGRLR